MKNLIETQLTEADQTAIDKAINDLENVIKDKLVALTQEERVKYGSVNEQNKLLVNKVRDYHQTDPSKSSPDVNWDNFETDYQARGFLGTRAQRLESIIYRMISTKILHDYDNYQDSLDEYAHANFRKGMEEPGFAEKVAELKQFFSRSGTAKPKPSAEEG